MHLVDDHCRFDGIDAGDAFAKILRELSDSGEMVPFSIGHGGMGRLFYTLRKSGFLPESFPSSTEFFQLFYPEGSYAKWEFSLLDPWDHLDTGFKDSPIRRETHWHPLLLKFLAKLCVEEA